MHVQTAGFNRRSGAPVLGWARRFNSKGDVVTGRGGVIPAVRRPGAGTEEGADGSAAPAYRVTSAAAVRWAGPAAPAPSLSRRRGPAGRAAATRLCLPVVGRGLGSASGERGSRHSACAEPAPIRHSCAMRGCSAVQAYSCKNNHGTRAPPAILQF